jgi:transposase-like protein
MSGKSVTELAPSGHPKLGLSHGLLKYWIRQAKADGQAAFLRRGRLMPADEELRHLQRGLPSLLIWKDFIITAGAVVH